jgi:ribonucleotide reductase beta subunit family protein with ferritin-like domain
MQSLVTPKITLPKDTYTLDDYPQAVTFADVQNSVFWTHSEIEVEKDIQDILVNMTEAERHGVLTVLKVFTKYELIIGNEYWGNCIAKWYPRPEIERMASSFSFFELNVHAPFYNKINELLHLNTDEFYNSYVEDDTLRSRIAFIEDALSGEDKLYSLAVFAMLEGAVLYSSFAFLKHFQSQGKNKLINIVAGIDFSVRDENLHHEAGCWLFKTHLDEARLLPEDQEKLYNKIYEAAKIITEHEHRIVDMIFEKGTMEGITKGQLKNFVESRVDLCLQNLGLSTQNNPASNPVAEWFYLGITVAKMHDFFAKIGNQYHRNWNERGFIWSNKLEI